MPKLLDISKLDTGNVVMLEEHDDDRTARIARETEEHRQKLWKDKIVFLLVICASVFLFSLCGYVLLFGAATFDPSTKDLAKYGLTALFTGLVSFIAGQRVK
jgi:hypothetical protein